jgi:sulfur-carrier protein adenylyltransferase/sulfurtransferase
MEQESRYACMLNLPDHGVKGQQRLARGKVMVIGLGGLGCPVAQYLAASGIGHLGLMDGDTVTLSNLNRQILYGPSDIGQNKAEVSARKLSAQNPDITIVSYPCFLESNNADELLANHDIIVDCTDSFNSRYLIDDAAVSLELPVVHGAIYQYEGHVAVWNVLLEDRTRSITYKGAFPDVAGASIPNCHDGGVMPTLAGLVGCLQANEVIKYLTVNGSLLINQLLIVDTANLAFRRVRLGDTTVVPKVPTDDIDTFTITFEELLASTQAVQLIDVRSAEEHASFNIGGKNVPLNTFPSDIEGDERSVICYCTTGSRSAQAVALLRAVDSHRKVLSLAGGIKHLIPA